MKITVDTHPTIYNKTIGVITLNNPKALNAQDLEMVRTMHDTLKSWKKMACRYGTIMRCRRQSIVCWR